MFFLYRLCLCLCFATAIADIVVDVDTGDTERVSDILSLMLTLWLTVMVLLVF